MKGLCQKGTENEKRGLTFRVKGLCQKGTENEKRGFTFLSDKGPSLETLDLFYEYSISAVNQPFKVVKLML